MGIVTRSGLMGGACLLAATAYSTGHAQETDPLSEQGAGDSPREVLDTIIVTGRKREERLVDAPLSVLAVDGDDLIDANINEVEDLAIVAPGVTFNESANSRGRGPRIRGVGTNLFGDGVEASVATYVDGVVLGRQAMGINDLIDIERIEVLRGPQGTLFGKNASAGVINIVTKNPVLQGFDADASVNYGYQDKDHANDVRLAASLSGAVVEDVFGFRLTGYSNDREGYVTNVNTGNPFNDKEEWGVRGKLLWEATDDLSFLFSGDYADRDQNCCIATALTYGATRSTTPAFDPVTPGEGNTDAFVDREDAFFQSQQQWGASLTAEWSTPIGEITSITALRAFEVADNNEFENNPPGFGTDLLANSADQEQDQFTQEVRLNTDIGERIDLTLGVFWFDQTVDAQTRLLVRLRPGPPVPGGNDIQRSVQNTSFAIFGQGDIEITDDLTLLTGFRYTEETLDYEFERVVAEGGFFGFVPPIAFSGETEDSAWSGLIGVQYEIGEHMLYSTLSRGYKGQGVNVNNFVSQFEVDNGLEVVDAEVPTNFEVGARASWLENRLYVGVTGFVTEFEDYQLSVFDPDTNSSGLRNAASLETLGVEVDFNWLVTDGFQINGALTALDATYDEFPNGPCFPGQGVVGTACVDNDDSGTQTEPDTQDLSGAPLQNAPDLSWSLGLRYDRPIGTSGWNGFANATVFWQDEVQYNVDQDPRALDDAYSRTNAAIGVTSPNGVWSGQIYARNLFDEPYALTVLSGGTGDLGGQNQFLPFDYARVIGVRLDVNY